MYRMFAATVALESLPRDVSGEVSDRRGGRLVRERRYRVRLRLTIFGIYHRAHQQIRLQNELFLPCSPRSLVAYASCVSKLPKSRIDEARLAHSIK